VQDIFPKLTLEQPDIEAIDRGGKFIHFRGFIRYNDACAIRVAYFRDFPEL